MSAAIAAPFIIIGLCYIGAIAIVPCWLHRRLMKEDAKLPMDKKYMSKDMNTIYWVICCCCSCIGTVQFYIMAMNQMGMRRAIIESVESLKGNGAIVNYNPQAQQAGYQA